LDGLKAALKMAHPEPTEIHDSESQEPFTQRLLFRPGKRH
jgi:hypothetical protein